MAETERATGANAGAGTDAGAGTGSDAESDVGPGAICTSCPHHCHLASGAHGRCRARIGAGETVRSENYGRLTSIAVDPIEKKPIACWHPGARVLSVGSYGCTMSCPFCQNNRIAMAGANDVAWREVSPKELVSMAVRLQAQDTAMIGIAYTYNEPLAGWEYVRDCSVLAHEHGLVNVLVSNGMATPEVLSQFKGLIDAANIDLKAYGADKYRRLGGNWDAVQTTIATLAADPACHLEVTTLVVPGISDSAEDIDALAAWLASLSPAIPYHLTRFFPHWRMADVAPTPLTTMHALVEVARRHLEHVLLGNC